MIYLFSKKFFTIETVEKMSKEEAEHEFEEDIIGIVLMYSDIKEFTTDFNNGCINPGELFMKNY